MTKTLVTGANGFLGKSISDYFSQKGHTVFSLSRQELDVSDRIQVLDWFKNNEVDYVIHTAIKGGRRGQPDTFSDYILNLKMFENLFECRQKYSLMINFGSGAEFDRRNNIDLFEEDKIFDTLPEDFYGLAKNMITRKIIRHNSNVYNFRLFGCFGANEAENRLLKVLYRGIEDQSKAEIDSDKKMDFFYDKDVCRAIEFYIDSHEKTDLPRDVNLVYEEKMNLGEISKTLERTVGLSNDNLSLNNTRTNSYTGDWKLCAKTFPKDLFSGFQKGLFEIYGGLECPTKK